MRWFKRRKRNSEDSRKSIPAIYAGMGPSKIHEDPEAAKARKRKASIAFLENWGWKPGFAWSSSWDAFVSCYKFPGYKTGVLFFYDDQQGWVLYPSGTDWHWDDEGEAHNVLHALVWDALKGRVEKSNWSGEVTGSQYTLRSEHEDFNITMSSPSTLEEPTFRKIHKEVGWPRTEITIDEVLELTSDKDFEESPLREEGAVKQGEAQSQPEARFMKNLLEVELGAAGWTHPTIPNAWVSPKSSGYILDCFNGDGVWVILKGGYGDPFRIEPEAFIRHLRAHPDLKNWN